VVVCLDRGADCLHMVQLMPLHPQTPSSLASFKSRLVLPFWCRLTQAGLEMRTLNGCSSSSFLVFLSPCATLRRLSVFERTQIYHLVSCISGRLGPVDPVQLEDSTQQLRIKSRRNDPADWRMIFVRLRRQPCVSCTTHKMQQ